MALRLICEREAEIEIFKPQEYWSVESDFTTPRGDQLTARLTHLNGVKLDRSLVAKVPGDQADETLCRCLIQVARSFGLRVVAVGDETVAQRDFLLEQGCELMQGRLFHAPASGASTSRLLLDREEMPMQTDAS